MSEDFFAPPPFRPDDAIAGLKRQLRELRLAERAGVFELKGQAIAAVALKDGAIEARLVKRPARTPEWTTRMLTNAADVRRFVETAKRQLADWSSDE